MFGALTAQIIKTSSASKVPREPITKEIGVKAADGSALLALEKLGPQGEFTIVLPPGEYEVMFIQLTAADLGTEPVRLPLSVTEKLRFLVPPAGCVYTGHVDVLYGRLPAGTIEQQAEVIGQLHNATGQDYGFVFLPDGGFVITGGKLDVPPVAQRPAAARNCPVGQFTAVPA